MSTRRSQVLRLENNLSVELSLLEKIAKLEKELAKQRKINNALMDRVERSVNDTAGAYSLFERNITLQQNVAARTAELLKVNEEVLRAYEIAEHARAEAEHASRAKSDFLATMSHEIRTPMNAFMGMTYLVLQTDLNAKQRHYIERADAAARNLLNIINDILDFSKIEAGKLNFEIIDFNLDEVIANLRSTFLIKALEKSIELRFQIANHIPKHLLGDPLRLVQVLTNLVGNALKFTERGKISITIDSQADVTSSTKVHETPSIALIFTIEDSGMGLNDEQKTRLFQAFSQADNSTTRKFGGTGLGLTISKNLVERMGGQIGVESEFGVGSKFFFTARFGISASQQSLELSYPSPSKRILILDRDDHNRLDYQAQLTSSELHVDTVAQVSDVIERLAKSLISGGTYDLLLIDLPTIEDESKDESKDASESALLRIQAIKRVMSLPIYLMVPFAMMDKKEGANDQLQREVTAVLFDTITPHSLQALFAQAAASSQPEAAKYKRRLSDYQEEQRALYGARILLVEDNEINQEVAKEILSSAGILVDVANHGAEAVSKLQFCQYDAVLMDCQMPVMNGFEATKILRADSRFQHLPIIAMTANAMSGDREKSLNCGMNDHVTKPINLVQLFATLTRWIRLEPSGHLPFNALPTSANDRSVLPECLPPFDLNAALLRVNGKPELLRSLLVKFNKNHVDTIQQLRGLCLDQNWNEAERLCHTLAGLAATFEIAQLPQAARALESAIRERRYKPCDDLIYALDAALAPALSACASLALSDTQASSTRQVIDKAQVLASIDALAVELDNCMLDSETASNTLLELLGTHFPDLTQTLAQQIAVFDFDEAQKTLSRISKAVSGI